MDYKRFNGAVISVKSADTITYINEPFASELAFDDSIPWEHSDLIFILSEDGQAFIADKDVGYLERLKSFKLDELNSSFSVRTRGQFTTTSGYVMQFDTSDSLKMQGAITLMETTGQTEGYLTQADDTTVRHVPLATMKAVLVDMLAAYAACHARKQELRAAINAAQTAEALDKIIISWPV